MPATNRTHHGEEDAEIAYRLQVMGAREGAIKGTLVGGTLVALANWRCAIELIHSPDRFPWMRRQTLAGKAFLVSWVTIFGMVTHADHYLLNWEQEHRVASERWRTQARNELSAQGLVPSETAMRRWKEDYDARLRETVDSAPAAATPPPAVEAAAAEQQSAVLKELELAKTKAPRAAATA
ncbi:hypothetical protein JCM1841_001424 [Sporobolomyces salmonicolor]